jgi:hypothetical protein
LKFKFHLLLEVSLHVYNHFASRCLVNCSGNNPNLNFFLHVGTIYLHNSYITLYMSVTFTHVWTCNMWQCVKLHHSVLLPVHGNANEAEVHTVCTTESKAVKTKIVILSDKMLPVSSIKPQHFVAWLHRFYPASWKITMQVLVS